MSMIAGCCRPQRVNGRVEGVKLTLWIVSRSFDVPSGVDLHRQSASRAAAGARREG